MKEKDIIAPYMLELEKTVENLWWYKIRDNKFTGKKPFDVFGAYRYLFVNEYSRHMSSRPLAIEFKIHKSTDRWPYDKVIPYQKESLLNIAGVGADARVVLCVKTVLTDRQKKELGSKVKRISFYKSWSIEELIKEQENNTHFDVLAHIKGTLSHG